MALAVLAGAAAAVSPPSIEAQAAEGTDVARTVRVDPQGWATTSADPAVTVVCTVDQVAAHLIDRTAVVLSGVRHRGPLELRGRTGVTVRGEAGAVLDATGARFALSLRDVADVAVRDLVLSGGTAQTVWVERTRGVTLERVVVQGSAGSGVQVRDSAGFSLTAYRVQDAASAGVMELTGVTDSRYTASSSWATGTAPRRTTATACSCAGRGVSVRDVVTTDNGSSALYEHGMYVWTAARAVTLAGVRSSGNAGVALKLGGSGTSRRSCWSTTGSRSTAAPRTLPGGRCAPPA